MTKQEKTLHLKNKLLQAGLDKVGIAQVARLDKSDFLKTWLQDGRHGDMAWMENYLEKRMDITKLFPGAKSVVMIAHNYYTAHKHSTAKDAAKISRYAWGRDYHTIIKKKLKAVLNEFKSEDATLEGRIFTDSAPVQEKLWAVQAGLGWQGKHTNVITQDLGSWVFLGGIVLNQELEYDGHISDHCGKCTACIDACPTNALQPYKIDAQRCLSYLTIEYWNKPIPEEFAGKMNNWVFGCDICQEVCPWNRRAVESGEEKYQPQNGNEKATLLELLNLNESDFKTRFKKSPVYRAKYDNFMRNIKTVIKKSVE